MSDADFIGALADLFTRTVFIERLTGRDAAGKPTFGASTPYAARINMKGQALRTLDGTVILGRGLIDLLTTDAIGVQDRLTMPSDFDPLQPPILNVRNVDGETGPLYMQLLIG